MIRSESDGLVSVLTLDRHAQRNALNPDLLTGLQNGLDDALAAGSRCVVITGAGSSFCSGADLQVVTEDGFQQQLYALLHRLGQIEVPVIAAVNGPAIGAGTQLAIACDLRVAGPNARFAVPTARLGLAVDPWSVRRLAALAGGGAARAMLLGVDTLDAERAHRLGLVDRLGELSTALAWAAEIAALAPLTLRYSKLALDAASDLVTTDERVALALDTCWNSADAAEGLRARAAGQTATFTGQ